MMALVPLVVPPVVPLVVPLAPTLHQRWLPLMEHRCHSPTLA